METADIFIIVYGDIKLNVGSDLVRSLGCKDFTYT